MKPAARTRRKPVHTLAIDIGGTGLKASVLDQSGRMLVDPVRMPTPYPDTPRVMLAALRKLVAPLPAFDRIAVGFPGVVNHGTVRTAPHFSTKAWRDFPLEDAVAKALGKPTHLLNDAEVQGLGIITGRDLELVVTLGTGVGTALFRDGALMPHLELAHHPLHGKQTYNDHLGDAARRRVGKKAWNRRVATMIDVLQSLLHYDRLYIGGGNSRHITFKLPRNVTLASNDSGITGGIRLWEDAAPSRGTPARGTLARGTPVGDSRHTGRRTARKGPGPSAGIR